MPAALRRTASRNSSPTRTSDGRHVALVDGHDPEHGVLRVEDHDAQLLALEAAHLEDQPVGDVARRADRPAAERPVGQQPPAELERRLELRRLAEPMPGIASSSSSVARARPGRPSWRGERVGRDVDRRPAANPAAPQQRDQLRGGQPAGARAGRAARAVAPRRAARGSCGRRRGRGTVGLQPSRSPPGARRTRRPRARTTEARRFPPPSGPEDDAEH